MPSTHMNTDTLALARMDDDGWGCTITSTAETSTEEEEMATRTGPMVLRYSYQGREYEHGGYTPEEVPRMIGWMAEEGITGVTAFDGVEFGRERFPVGCRVVITHDRKWWGSQLGAVAEDEHGVTWLATDMGPEVMVRFDGEKYVGSWTARSLDRIN